MANYTPYLTTGRPFTPASPFGMGGPMGLGSPRSPYAPFLTGLFPDIRNFMQSYGGHQGSGDISASLPSVSMGESSPYAGIVESLFGGGIGNTTLADVLLPNQQTNEFIQSRTAYI